MLPSHNGVRVIPPRPAVECGKFHQDYRRLATQPCPRGLIGLGYAAGLGEAMKQRRERETAPLWVWFFFGLMAVGVGAYLTGYWMFEEMVAHVKK